MTESLKVSLDFGGLRRYIKRIVTSQNTSKKFHPIINE